MSSFSTEQMQQIHQMLSNNEKKETKAQFSTKTPSAAANTSGINIFNLYEPWILDSGATHHIICTTRYYTHNVKTFNSTVQLPNEQTTSISHIGSIKINDELTLNNVLCVPSFKLNLVSLSKLIQESNLSVIFSKNCCLITQASIPYIKSLNRIGRIESQKGLFHFAFELLHCDLWGPYSVKTLQGHSYFLQLLMTTVELLMFIC